MFWTMHFDIPRNHWILSLCDLFVHLVCELCLSCDSKIVRIHLTWPVCFVCTFDHSCFCLSLETLFIPSSSIKIFLISVFWKDSFINETSDVSVKSLVIPYQVLVIDLSFCFLWWPSFTEITCYNDGEQRKYSGDGMSNGGCQISWNERNLLLAPLTDIHLSERPLWMCFLKTSKAHKNSLTFISTFHFENKRTKIENIRIFK